MERFEHVPGRILEADHLLDATLVGERRSASARTRDTGRLETRRERIERGAAVHFPAKKRRALAAVAR